MRGGPSPRVDFAGALRTRAEAVSTRRCGRSEPQVLRGAFWPWLRRAETPPTGRARRRSRSPTQLCSKHSASSLECLNDLGNRVGTIERVNGVPVAQQPRGVAGRQPQAPGLAHVGLFEPCRRLVVGVDRRYAVDAQRRRRGKIGNPPLTHGREEQKSGPTTPAAATATSSQRCARRRSNRSDSASRRCRPGTP